MFGFSTLIYLTPPFVLGFVLGFLKLRPLLVAGGLFAVLAFLGLFFGIGGILQEGNDVLFAFLLIGPTLLVFGGVTCAIIYAGMLCGKAVRDKRDYE